MERDVAVIGAGLAGAATALALAREGVRVTLIERDDRPVNRASLRNEGKIHLGLIYAAEPGRRTALRQLEGALSFRRLLAEWVGPEIDALPVAAPFVYLAAPDSVLGPDALEEHFAAIEDACRRTCAADAGADYLGARPDRLARRLSRDGIARWFAPERAQAAWETAELAIDTEALAAAVTRALARTPEIELLTGRRVREAEAAGDGFALSGDGAHGPWRMRARQVVNAAWDDLYALDAQAGPTPPPGWLHRLKYRVMARLPQALDAAPSLTIVIGPYGDVVVRPGGLSYLSWYPEGLQGWTGDLAPPEDWQDPSRGAPDPAVAADMARRILDGLEPWMPGVAAARPEIVDAGPILAHGRSDVDDPESGLHGRMVTGVASRGGWHSLNPGKLTTAPLHAAEAAAAVLAHAGRAPGAALPRGDAARVV